MCGYGLCFYSACGWCGLCRMAEALWGTQPRYHAVSLEERTITTHEEAKNWWNSSLEWLDLDEDDGRYLKVWLREQPRDSMQLLWETAPTPLGRVIVEGELKARV